MAKLNKGNDLDFCCIALDAIHDNFGRLDVASILGSALSNMRLDLGSLLCLAAVFFEKQQGGLIRLARIGALDVIKVTNFICNQILSLRICSSSAQVLREISAEL